MALLGEMSFIFSSLLLDFRLSLLGLDLHLLQLFNYLLLFLQVDNVRNQREHLVLLLANDLTIPKNKAIFSNVMFTFSLYLKLEVEFSRPFSSGVVFNH